MGGRHRRKKQGTKDREHHSLSQPITAFFPTRLPPVHSPLQVRPGRDAQNGAPEAPPTPLDYSAACSDTGGDRRPVPTASHPDTAATLIKGHTPAESPPLAPLHPAAGESPDPRELGHPERISRSATASQVPPHSPSFAATIEGSPSPTEPPLRGNIKNNTIIMQGTQQASLATSPPRSAPTEPAPASHIPPPPPSQPDLTGAPYTSPNGPSPAPYGPPLIPSTAGTPSQSHHMDSDTSPEEGDSTDNSDVPEYWGDSPPAKKKLFRTPSKSRASLTRQEPHSSSDDSRDSSKSKRSHCLFSSDPPVPVSQPSAAQTISSPMAPSLPSPEAAALTLKQHPELQALLALIPTKMDMLTMAEEMRTSWRLSQLSVKVSELETFRATIASEVHTLRSATTSLLSQHAHMVDHLDDMDNRNRRNNIRVKGLPESVVPQDISGTLQRIFNDILKRPPDSPVELDRAHRALKAKSPD